MRSLPAAHVLAPGYGGIGTVVADRLATGPVSGARLTAVVSRSGASGAPVPVLEPDEALEDADIVVGCAGVDAVRGHAEHILSSDCDLVLSATSARSTTTTWPIGFDVKVVAVYVTSTVRSEAWTY
ncbi:hypothetical protein [Streptomyces umbrinus]|uniref:hypothetical protein n=1 Tax=Streptomyces umbrinus TaxID=67370 RepID=UPI0033C92994